MLLNEIKLGTKSDPEALKAFMADMRANTEAHPFARGMVIHNDSVGVEVSIFDGKIHLSSIMSFVQKNAGEASKTLKFLTDLADKHQVIMDLAVSPIKNAGAREGKSLTKAQLTAWYGRYGFKKARGDYMERPPGAAA
jgi:hypothetical protein